MIGPLRIAGQFGLVAALFAGVVSLADWPVYRATPAGSAVVVFTFVHGADRRAQCRKLSPEEIARLPRNMRRTEECPRRRQPLYVELDVDGRNLYRASLPPTGIAGDGPSRVYQRFVLPAGPHDIAVRMRDTPRTDGFDHARSERVALAADQMLVVDFRAEGGGEFVFR